MAMTLNKKKQLFSIAYLYALSSVTGYKMMDIDEKLDDESIDIVLKGYLQDGMKAAPLLDIQLKCTANDTYTKQPTIPFELKKKNYNDLSESRVAHPFILVVLIVPKELSQWTLYTEQELVLRHTAYWHSLKGQTPLKKEEKTRTIHLSRTNVLDINGLQRIMTNIGMTGDL